MSLDRLRAALADRYHLERELGQGGMATVYLAEDLKHRRQVAIKVMRPELAATLGAERFLREVEIAAGLSHPNILPVFDSGEADGFLYYVMPHIEGESLPDRLAREKQLPVGEALRIGREVAEALAHAHSRGIIHRDIKPANILLHSGHALVADFGIARAVASGSQALTQTGMAIGTPQYMSPEQATASAEVDGRSDIYSLGCVLYEMLAGEPPFTGPTAHAVLARSLTEDVRPLERTRASLSPQVSAVVMRALARTPADRHATGEELVSALLAAEDHARTPAPTAALRTSPPRPRWQLATAAVAILALGALGMKLLGGGGAASDSSSKTVAVLPFENLGSSDDAYFADGMVEELRDKLARLAQLTVTASASSDLYRGTSKTATDIARELRVDQVLTGKVRWATGNDGARQVRVAAELIDGSTGKVTWRDTFDADMANAFEIQGRIATRVAAALGTLLAPKEAENLAGRPTQNAEAHEIFLKAAAITAQGMQGYRARIVLLEQVVALDPGFARAWALLTANLSAQYAEGTGDPAIARRAREALDRTMALASDSAGAHVIAAEYHTNVAHDRDSARASIERALELAPKDAWVLSSSAGYDLSDGNYQQMFEKLTRAREINPLSRTVIASLIEAQMLTGRVDEAAATTNELMALEPTAYIQMQWILFARLAAGDIEGARAAVREFLSRVPASELVTFFAGYQELAFLLPDDAVALLFRMSPAAFDDDLAWWGQSLAMAADQRGDRTRARAYADSGLAVAQQQVEAAPDDPQLRILYAVMLGYTGMNDEAVRQRDRAIAALTSSYPPRSTTYVHLQAARVDLALGRNDAALDQIEIALGGEGYVTPGYLKADPMFVPLKGNPRFEQLVAGGLSVPVD